MLTKTYLEQIGRIEKLIQNKKIEEDRVRELCGNVAIKNDGERVVTSGISDPTAQVAVELVAIQRQVDRWLRKRQKIIEQIDAIEDLLSYEILTYRYVQQRSMFDISDKLGRTETQTWRLLNKAHKDFEEKFGEEYATKCKQM